MRGMELLDFAERLAALERGGETTPATEKPA
jgi:hypothetical protein